MTILAAIAVSVVSGLIIAGVTSTVTWWTVTIKQGAKIDNLTYRITTVEAATQQIRQEQNDFLHKIHGVEKKVISLNNSFQR